MRPSISSKHRDQQERLRKAMEEYERKGGKVSRHDPSERAKPPVDHWQERVSEDYRVHQENK